MGGAAEKRVMGHIVAVIRQGKLVADMMARLGHRPGDPRDHGGSFGNGRLLALARRHQPELQLFMDAAPGVGSGVGKARDPLEHEAALLGFPGMASAAMLGKPGTDFRRRRRHGGTPCQRQEEEC